MKKLFAVMLAVVLTMTLAGAAMAAKPATFTTSYHQAQFQWRASAPLPSGTWSPLYRNSTDSSDFRLTGNVLHTAWSYSPVVTDLTGESTVYTYDKKSDRWIEKEGTVSYRYVPGYGDYAIVNYFRGFLEFGGAPSADSLEHGVAYQWVYLLAPQAVPPSLQYAIWDDTMDAWLIGFSIYLWDPTTTTQSYTMQFPDPFIKPGPASNYDPLDL